MFLKDLSNKNENKNKNKYKNKNKIEIRSENTCTFSFHYHEEKKKLMKTKNIDMICQWQTEKNFIQLHIIFFDLNFTMNIYSLNSNHLLV